MSEDQVARAIFISYRRDDAEGEAGRLFDDLIRSFSEDSVFMDVAGIDPGTDFRTAIDSNVASCGVLLAVIGPAWTTVKSPSGTRRLDDANDFVRLEIASALQRKIAVIPVLVHDAKMPHPDDLPDNLKDLAYRNSVEITHARWNSDVQLLTKALTQYVESTRATDTKPVHATVSVQLPAPYDARPSRASGARSKTPIYAGVVALLLAAGAGSYLLVKHRASPPAPVPAPLPSPTPTPQPITPKSKAQPNADPDTSNSNLNKKQPPPPVINPLIGTWSRSGAGPDSIVEVTVQADGSGGLSVHAKGACAPKLCDWGTQAAELSGSSAITHWVVDPPSQLDKFVKRSITIKPDDGNIDVSIDNIKQNGQIHNKVFQFVPGAATASLVTPAPAPEPKSRTTNPTPAPISAQPSILGTWTRPAPPGGTNRLVRLLIELNKGNQVRIHAWGNCLPSDCDWGAQVAPLTGTAATAFWPHVAANDLHPVDHQSTITVEPRSGHLYVDAWDIYPHGRTHFEGAFSPAR